MISNSHSNSSTMQPFDIEVEVASQPRCWTEAAALAPAVAGGLPPAGARIAVVGCGTSFFMAQAFAALREAAGQGESDAFPASELPAGRRYDCVVAITRSGTTTEVLEALARLPDTTRTVAITAARGTPILDAVNDAVVLDFADERSIVQTRFATSTLLLLRRHLGEDVGGVVEQAWAALGSPLPNAVSLATQFTFLGMGWTVGLAHEAALKLREAAGAWAESYPAMEYRHGPISVTGPGSLVWVLSDPPEGLNAEIEHAGGAVELTTLDPLADLIRIQRAAISVAVGRGLDPDAPRNLTRSVVLTSDRDSPDTIPP